MTRAQSKRILSQPSPYVKRQAQETGETRDFRALRRSCFFSPLLPLPAPSCPSVPLVVIRLRSLAGSTAVYGYPDFTAQKMREECCNDIENALETITCDCDFSILFKPPPGIAFWLERVANHLAGRFRGATC